MVVVGTGPKTMSWTSCLPREIWISPREWYLVATTHLIWGTIIYKILLMSMVRTRVNLWMRRSKRRWSESHERFILRSTTSELKKNQVILHLYTYIYIFFVCVFCLRLLIFFSFLFLSILNQSSSTNRRFQKIKELWQFDERAGSTDILGSLERCGSQHFLEVGRRQQSHLKRSKSEGTQNIKWEENSF